MLFIYSSEFYSFTSFFSSAMALSLTHVLAGIVLSTFYQVSVCFNSVFFVMCHVHMSFVNVLSLLHNKSTDQFTDLFTYLRTNKVN